MAKAAAAACTRRVVGHGASVPTPSLHIQSHSLPCPSCPQRSRLLATLCKDERCAKLPVYPFLEKVYMERILGKAEVGIARVLPGYCQGYCRVL